MSWFEGLCLYPLDFSLVIGDPENVKLAKQLKNDNLYIRQFFSFISPVSLSLFLIELRNFTEKGKQTVSILKGILITMPQS